MIIRHFVRTMKQQSHDAWAATMYFLNVFHQ